MTSSSLPISSSNAGESGSQTDDGSALNPKTATLIANSNGLHPSVAVGQGATMLDLAASDGIRADGFVRKKLSKLLKGKEEEWAAVAQRKGPLRLLDLPVDVLKEIIKEVTHTNDLTALALTHSALHNLAIPHIYSRFDIVWPEANLTSDTRTGVDALTYGLATLVMGHDVFQQPPFLKTPPGGPRSGQRRLGNNYPQFTRKFSLGNGPPEWVQEYMITKESGKMLGTLVAVAVARMVNLETFIWDMPTGVLRDVWLALSSLQTRSPSGQCRLERLLVRWHDNSLESSQSSPRGNVGSNPATIPPAGSMLTSVGIMVPPTAAVPVQQGAASQVPAISNRVEHPTLSVLPPLRSLSVLDIDELAYLDEMSILIEKSKDRLRELRVGIAKKAASRHFVLAWDGAGLQQVDHTATWSGAPNTIGDRRLGGVLGVLLGRVYDIRRKTKVPIRSKPLDSPIVTPQGPQSSPPMIAIPVAPANAMPNATNHAGPVPTLGAPVTVASAGNGSPALHLESLAAPAGYSVPEEELLIHGTHATDAHVSATITSPGTEFSQPAMNLSSIFTQPRIDDKSPRPTTLREPSSSQRQYLEGKLRLDTLELERVPLSVAVLQKAFDWPMMTSLTILDCKYHENLWRMLRRQFQPQMSTKSALATSSILRQSISSNSASKAIPSVSLDYQLNLKKIHTDFATGTLITFLKETLAPNTLEVLFLQDRRRNAPPTVSIHDIYRGPLKRHRRSLKKLLIDSSDKIPKGPKHASDSVRWKTWMLNHEVLSYITSGNMTSLRELSVAIEYKDWHFFLRRLPQIPSLRSLNIPFIADHVTPAYDPRELAMQVVDMIFLRPEIELCYMGISNKCFEILENRSQEDLNSNDVLGNEGTDVTDEEEEEDEDGSEEEADEDEEGGADGTATEAVDVDSVDYDTSDTGDSEAESSSGSEDDRTKFSLRLREILFYDDKVAIFKARHMRL